MIAKVVFRVDAGHKYGLGHLVRCLTLAEILRKKTQAQIIFAMADDESGVKIPKDFGFEVLKIPVDWKALWPNIVVIDLKVVEHLDIVPIKQSKARIVCLDNPTQTVSWADVVINSLILPPSVYYTGSFSGVCEYRGTQYLILKDKFRKLHSNTYNVKDRAEAILITCGGSDPWGLTQRVISGLEYLNNNIHIDVLIGPLFKGKNLLKERLKGLKNFSYIENLELADIVERYDLAVCSFGLTVYELACCGVPALIVPATDELDTIAEEFVRYGSAEKVNLNANPSQILHATKKICFDFNLRKEMSRQGKALVDGKGAERVANILIKFL